MNIDETDEIILEMLSEGRCTQGYLVTETDIPRYRIHERLKMYGKMGYAKNLHENTALWELVNDPREEDDDDN